MEAALALFLCICVQFVTSEHIVCGRLDCYGDRPYCCQNDSGEVDCCWGTFVYQLWWFWFIWIVIFFLVLGCSLAWYRRRRTQYRYMVMANSVYPTYGTVVAGEAPAGIVYGTPGTVPGSAASAPPGLPAYDVTTRTSKPPPYTG